MTGQKFGRLTVLRQGPSTRSAARWYCRCDCGEERLVPGIALRSGNSTSCGCYSREVARQICIERNAGGHGKAPRGALAKIYVVWLNMIQRCTNPKHPRYRDYGGRGIAVCPEWRRFENFYAHMGDRPAGMTLNRIDNNRGYEPGNCEWATPSEQNKNQRRRTRKRKT